MNTCYALMGYSDGKKWLIRVYADKNKAEEFKKDKEKTHGNFYRTTYEIQKIAFDNSTLGTKKR